MFEIKPVNFHTPGVHLDNLDLSFFKQMNEVTLSRSLDTISHDLLFKIIDKKLSRVIISWSIIPLRYGK